MLLEKNGKRSSSCRMRHINIHYFFVTDRIQSKEVAIEYCLADKMLADMFTKPLQGPAFRRFRAAVLNLPDTNEICPATVPMMGHRSVLGNESATESAASDNRQTRKSIKSERSREMADVVKRMAKNSVGRKSELNAHSF